MTFLPLKMTESNTFFSVNSITRSVCIGLDLQDRYNILDAEWACPGIVVLKVRYLQLDYTVFSPKIMQ